MLYTAHQEVVEERCELEEAENDSRLRAQKSVSISMMITIMIMMMIIMIMMVSEDDNALNCGTRMIWGRGRADPSSALASL